MNNEKKSSTRVFTRENILMASACITLIAAIGFATAGFIVPPMGEIHESIEWVIAQFLLYTGSALGIATYTYYGFKKMQTRINHELGRRGEHYADEDDLDTLDENERERR